MASKKYKHETANINFVIPVTEWKDKTALFADRIESVASDIKDRMKELETAMSQTDLEITDIQHYIEMSSLDVRRGYNAYKMLKERLEKRRMIKDEYDYLYYIIEGNGMKKSHSWLDNKNKRGYQPRMIKELFK